MLEFAAMKLICLSLLLRFVFNVQAAKVPEYQHLPPLREQAAIQDAWRDQRISHIPQILQKYGVDAWLMSQREHAEDTVFWSMKRATQFAARRRTTQLFFANATEPIKPVYTWIDNTPEVWESLLDVLETQNPRTLAVNIDSEVAFSSGMHAGELRNVKERLGKRWSDRLVNEPMIAVEYIGTMIKDRLPWYRKLQETAWAIIAEGFSERVITPGETTTEDVEWWMRSKIQELNYTTWFQPSVSILDGTDPFENLTTSAQQATINLGDLLHVDFGVTAMGLNTDTQHLAYVLFPGEDERDIPQSLLDGLKNANRVQDIVKSNMKIGVSGNEILKACLKQMKSEGISGRVYSHPIGDWGHSAGTLVGMANLQDSVPVLGDLPLLDKTYYSVELYAEYFVPEQNKTINFFLEEDIYWTGEGDGWEWAYGQQTEFHLVKPPVSDLFRVQEL